MVVAVLLAPAAAEALAAAAAASTAFQNSADAAGKIPDNATATVPCPLSASAAQSSVAPSLDERIRVIDQRIRHLRDERDARLRWWEAMPPSDRMGGSGVQEIENSIREEEEKRRNLIKEKGKDASQPPQSKSPQGVGQRTPDRKPSVGTTPTDRAATPGAQVRPREGEPTPRSSSSKEWADESERPPIIDLNELGFKPGSSGPKPPGGASK